MGLRTAARLFALGCAALTGSAPAQVNLPSVRLPPLPATGWPVLLGKRPLALPVPNGEPMLRGQLIALDLSAAALERIAAGAFVRVREQRFEGADSSIDVLHPPPGMSTRRALRELRGLEPSAVFDYDNI